MAQFWPTDIQTASMEISFTIQLNIKVTGGFESYGKFCLGSDARFAEALFKKLKGREQVDEKNMLTLDFIQTANGLPINVKMISCNLEEMTENCRIITMELFKHLNLQNA